MDPQIIFQLLFLFKFSWPSFIFSIFENIGRKSFLDQVKHWMDPQIIPYGWGLFSEGEEVVKTTATKNFEGNGKQNNSSFMFYISNTIDDIYTFL